MTAKITSPLKYITEMYEPFDFDPRLAIADSVFDRIYNIFAFSIAEQITDPANYWIDWGGTFDNYDGGFGIQIFMDLFLTEVFLTATLEAIENTFYIDKVNDIVYMNIPKDPWQYFRSRSGFYADNDSVMASAPKDETNPSDILYDGNIKAHIRMDVPSISNQLNDIISGIKFYNVFEVVIDNHDGKYDGFNITRFFNTPIQILKSSDNAQSIEDFNRIQYGLISDINVDDVSMVVEGTDILFTLNKSYCKTFSVNDYPNAGDSVLNKDIPVLWGPVLGVELFQVDIDGADPPEWIDYIIIDKDYVTSVQAVYDKDGNELTHTFNAFTGIVRVTELDDSGEVIEADTSNSTGKTENTIADVITFALGENENLPYVVGIWDVTETDLYFAIADMVGFYFAGGTTRELVEKVLKNDMAFLIQKINGLLTLRQWGQEYDTHTIPSWVTTQNPAKNFENSYKYYCSTSKVLYEKNHKTNVFGKEYLNETFEENLFENYRKSFTAKFETDLIDDIEVDNFSDRLLERFGTIRETLAVGVGVDTFDVNLLDTINYDPNINGRQFSEFQKWIVRECNPGQDEIVIESNDIEYVLTFDGDDAVLDDDYLFEVVF